MADESVQELQKQLQDLNTKLKEAGGLGINMADAFTKAGNDTEKLKKYIDEVKKRLSEITDDADYIYQTFKNIGGELANQNTLLNTGKKSFQSLTSIAQNLNYYQKGNTDLSEKQFRSIKNSIGLHEKELQYAKRQLEITTKNNNSVIAQLEEKINKGEKLDAQEKGFLKNHQKEITLLENIGYTLENNIIGKLKNELKISKEISDVRRDIGGIAVSTAKVLSTYAGPLASFLNVNSAIEAVDDFSKRQIERALSSEKVQNRLLEIEQEKFKAQKEAAEAIRDINKENISQEDKDKKISSVKSTESKKILELEKDSVAVRRDAIKSTDNLGNRFKALGIAMKEMGAGLLKALTDPVTIIGLLIKLINRAVEGAYRVSQNVTNIGRALGVSSGLASTLSSQMISSAEAAGGIFVNAQNSVAAIQQLADGLGIAVQFSGKEIANQVKLTELLGLSADEAAKFAKISALTNMEADDFVTKVQEGAKASMNANKIHLSDKQVLQAVSKLSSSILLKFQGNPVALGAAITKAKALGVALEKLEGISESLLDFQSSIEAELEAELMTGRQLNLEQARYAALTGDQATLMKEINEQAGSYEDYQKLNVLAQKSLAKALGLTRDEMAEMYMDQKLANKYGEEALKLNAQQRQELEASGLSLGQYLKRQRDQLSLQEKTKAAQQRITELLDQKLLPFGVKLIDIFQDLQKLLIIVIEELLGGATKPLESIADEIKKWTKNSEGFREKIREWKKEFKENLGLIKNIAIAIGAIFVVSKAVTFFAILTAGFLKLKPLIKSLGFGKLFAKAPIPPPPPPPPASLSAAKFTLQSGKSFLQGGQAYSVATGQALQGAAKSSVIKAGAKQVFVDPIKNILTNTGKSIQQGALNLGNSIKNIPTTVGKGLTTAGQSIQSGAITLGKNIKNLPSNIAIRGITAASRAKEAIGATSLTQLGGKGVSAVGKTILRGGTGGAISGIVGGVLGFMESKEVAINEKLKKDSAALKLNQQLKEGTITQEEYDEQITARKKELGKDVTGQAVGGGLTRGTSALLGAGIGATIGAIGGPIGIAIGGFVGGYLGDTLGSWINKKAPGVAERFGAVWDSVSKKFQKAFEPWKKVFTNIQEGLDKFLKSIGIEGGLGSALSFLAEYIGDSLLYPFKVLLGVLGGVMDAVRALGQLLSGDFSGAWQTMKQGFLDLGGIILSPFKGLFNTITDAAKAAWQKLYQLLPEWLGGESDTEEAFRINKEKAEAQARKDAAAALAEKKKSEKEQIVNYMTKLTSKDLNKKKLDVGNELHMKEERLNQMLNRQLNIGYLDENKFKNQKVNVASLRGYQTNAFGIQTPLYGPTPIKSKKDIERETPFKSPIKTTPLPSNITEGSMKMGPYIKPSNLDLIYKTSAESAKETTKEMKELNKKITAYISKPQAPIVIEWDGVQMTKKMTSLPEMQQGLGKNRSLLS